MTGNTRYMMTMAQFFTHCHHCPFLHMPSECKRAQKIRDYCPRQPEKLWKRDDIEPLSDVYEANK